MDGSRRQNENSTLLEQSQSQLKIQIEARLGELRDVLLEMRTKVDMETQERQRFEQQTALRLADVNAAVVEQDRKREEAVTSIDRLHRDKQHHSDTDKIKLQSKVVEMGEEITKKMGQKEIRLREEMHEKFAQLQNLIENELERRMGVERDIRNEVDRRFDEMKRLSDQEVQTIKDLFKNEKQKQKTGINELYQSINLVEKQLDEQKRQLDKVLTAEIKSRKKNEERTKENVDAIENKLQLALAALQNSMSGLNSQMNAQTEKVKELTNFSFFSVFVGLSSSYSIGIYELKKKIGFGSFA